MIIRGFWVRGKPVCYGGIILRGRIYIPVELEVDTGASITMVSDVKNRIDPDIEKEWGIQTRQVSAFGGAVAAYEIRDCILVLDGIGGKVHRVELQKFYLAKKTRPGKLRRYIPFVRQKTRKGDTGTSHKNSPPPPNVLGRDVLSRFLLVMDGRSRGGIWLTSRPTKIEIENHPVMHFGKHSTS